MVHTADSVDKIEAENGECSYKVLKSKNKEFEY